MFTKGMYDNTKINCIGKKKSKEKKITIVETSVMKI